MGRNGRARRARAAVRVALDRAAGRPQASPSTSRRSGGSRGASSSTTPASSSSLCRRRIRRSRRCWGFWTPGAAGVKLSAPYETSKKGAPHYEDVGALAKELVVAAPERMLWASNWPHPSVPKEKRPDDADLLGPAARLGAGRRDAAQDPGGQPGGALQIGVDHSIKDNSRDAVDRIRWNYLNWSLTPFIRASRSPGRRAGRASSRAPRSPSGTAPRRRAACRARSP